MASPTIPCSSKLSFKPQTLLMPMVGEELEESDVTMSGEHKSPVVCEILVDYNTCDCSDSNMPL